MAAADPCWTSADVDIAGAVLARLLLADDRVRACLDAAGGR